MSAATVCVFRTWKIEGCGGFGSCPLRWSRLFAVYRGSGFFLRSVSSAGRRLRLCPRSALGYLPLSCCRLSSVSVGGHRGHKARRFNHYYFSLPV